MINMDYDRARGLVSIEFSGDIGTDEARASTGKLDRLIPGHNEHLTLLVDFSSVGSMDPEVEDEVKKSMAMLAARDLRHVVRVLPEPAADFTFDLLERCVYSRDVNVRTVRTRAEGEAELRRIH